jgi:hypothetical protein
VDCLFDVNEICGVSLALLRLWLWPYLYRQFVGTKRRHATMQVGVSLQAPVILTGTGRMEEWKKEPGGIATINVFENPRSSLSKELTF